MMRTIAKAIWHKSMVALTCLVVILVAIAALIWPEAFDEEER